MKNNQNAKEIKEFLWAQYPYRIELHAHTAPVSGCSEISAEELVRVYGQQGFHGVVLTNHMTPGQRSMDIDTAVGSHLQDLARAKAVGERCGVAVFLGVEVRFAENINDYLIYGVDEAVLRSCYQYLDKTVADFRREVFLPDSVFIQAHPFRNGMVLCEPALLDGMECINLHPHHNSCIGLATRYAYAQGFPVKTAGSDYHHPGHQALTALRTKTMPESSFDIARILKSGDYIFELGDGSLWIP